MDELPLSLLGGRYVLRRAAPNDAHTVLRDLRMDDWEEWELSIQGGVPANLENSILVSDECYTIADTRTGAAHIIFGVASQASGPPTTWLLGTNSVEQDAAWLLLECRPFYLEFFSWWPHTVCYSAPHNVTHHKWLLWMGYRLAKVTPWGDAGLPFHEYVKTPPPPSTREA